ncbi:insulinase family protein [Salipaludibacillus sp. CUR1]|uniref:EF-P 5-aminopentanol modification-associated protein YfmH n=1 Tax=Salipaludibacillus sp. CUR1 TaxID=2820003 RepID=UPI001E37CED7|nr:pitrilysin family protein [Salipaludibacillus sp. CUR1]MCE7790892.1 insulinase family protein [Salipaludibacillus sp. CUR1]
MNSINYVKLGEIIHHRKLSNGLEVFVLPKNNFQKTFATFTTNFGSVDNSFIPFKGGGITHVPEGLAHFLEHQLFESEKGNVFQTFAARGAFVNAFTTFNRTAYTLSATSHIEKNLTFLLDFVQSPYFTNETLNREKGVIEQEIKMKNDNPEWRSRFGILENMYKSHPVKSNIAGTITSLNQILKEDLYNCYNTFYHPKNMLLFVTGPVVPEEIFSLIRDNQENKEFHGSGDIQRIYPHEDSKVKLRSSVLNLPVGTPKVFIGHKDPKPFKQGQELLTYELAQSVLLELMFGKSSDAYEKLYRNGYIDESFDFDCVNEKGFGFSVIGGDSQEPEKVIAIVKETISKFKSSPILNARRAINKKIGGFLRSLNSPQFIANQFSRYQFNQMDLFDVLPTLKELSEKDLEEVLQFHLSEYSRTSLIVKGDR